MNGTERKTMSIMKNPEGREELDEGITGARKS